MTNKVNIAVVAGGDSSEFIVSIKSGNNVYQAIDTSKFTPWLIHMKGSDWKAMDGDQAIADIDKSDFSFEYEGQKIKFDFIYITIHGTPGEDGLLQGYFDMLKIPYSSCDVHASALTFNKWSCSNYLRSFEVKMARSIKLSAGDTIDSKGIVEKLGLPLFIKPNAGGSSFGISKVKKIEDIETAMHKAWKESNDVLVEEFIEGTEFTCGLVKLDGKFLTFPVTEVLPKNEFFDFEAKYTPGAAEEITPARLPEDLFKKCQQLSEEIYEHCSCSGIVRIDFILHNNEFYFLEVNTTPGMTATSFIPQQIEAMGSSLKEVISGIVEDALN